MKRFTIKIFLTLGVFSLIWLSSNIPYIGFWPANIETDCNTTAECSLAIQKYRNPVIWFSRPTAVAGSEIKNTKCFEISCMMTTTNELMKRHSSIISTWLILSLGIIFGGDILIYRIRQLKEYSISRAK